MSKSLYEEALADARKLKEVAENNAKRAVEEAVMPKIRDMIERQLFEDLDIESHDETDGEILLDLVGGNSDTSPAAISPPDEEGKVTLDLDALHDQTPPASPDVPVSTAAPLGDTLSDGELELSVESLMDMFGDTKLNEALAQIEKEVGLCVSASKLIRESREFHDKIEELSERIQDTYQYVQERLEGSSSKSDIETKLEGFFKDMNTLKETTMKSVKDLMNEGDLTIKLTGVPDDLDVEDLGIDLITGEEEEGGDMEMPDAEAGGDDLDMGAPEDMGAPPGDDDMEEADLGAMSDDDVVEISEAMLKNEIKRMRESRLKREAASHPNSATGGKIPVDDFGGGTDEGDPWLDGDVTTAEDDPGEKLANESLDLDEGDMVGPGASQNQEQGHTTAAQPNDQKNEVALWTGRLQTETKVFEEAVKNYRVLVAEAKKAKDGAKKKAAADKAKKEADKAKKSKKRMSEMQNKIKEASQKLQKEGSENRGPATVAEDRGQVESLRKKLNESNLFNAKLLATNKLLQNESLSAKQKTSAIERLDEAKTVREVKLVYESIAKALSNRRSLAEGSGKVVGSSSRATAPGATLTESVEANRWARLAGIK